MTKFIDGLKGQASVLYQKPNEEILVRCSYGFTIASLNFIRFKEADGCIPSIFVSILQMPHRRFITRKQAAAHQITIIGQEGVKEFYNLIKNSKNEGGGVMNSSLNKAFLGTQRFFDDDGHPCGLALFGFKDLRACKKYLKNGYSAKSEKYKEWDVFIEERDVDTFVKQFEKAVWKICPELKTPTETVTTEEV